MHTHNLIDPNNPHQKARVEGLVHQIHQVGDQIHHVVDEIKEGVDLAMEKEETIMENKQVTMKHIEAATLVLHEAKARLAEIREQDFLTMSQFEDPPVGIEPLIKCCVYLLANHVPTQIIDIDSQKKPRSTSWVVCQNLLKESRLLNEGLHKIVHEIDTNHVSVTNIECIKNILGASFYDFEKLNSQTFRSLYIFIQKIVSYFDLVFTVTISQADTEKATADLESSSTRLIQKEHDLDRLKNMYDQLSKELNQATHEP